jgi:hypothetical protein
MGNYNAVKAAFRSGDWVVGIEEHSGCSRCFDMDTPHPQPFSYLSETDPSKFRLATPDEVLINYPELHKDDLVDYIKRFTPE